MKCNEICKSVGVLQRGNKHIEDRKAVSLKIFNGSKPISVGNTLAYGDKMLKQI